MDGEIFAFVPLLPLLLLLCTTTGVDRACGCCRLAVAVVGGVYRPIDSQHCVARSHTHINEAGTNSKGCARTSLRQRNAKKTAPRITSRSPSLSPSPRFASSAVVHGGWCAVDSSTIFMAYSVAKGCTAAAMLRLVDEGRLDWSEPIDQVWPELACQDTSSGGSDVGRISIAEAASHRLGLPGTPWPPMRFFRQYCSGGWRGMWDEGIAWAETTPTIWQPGERASYCHLGWSFVVGGLIERKCNEHVADTVQRVANEIKLPHCLHIGRLPTRLWHKTATLEVPPAGHNKVWSSALGQPLGLAWRVLGTIESFLFRRVGNSDMWRGSCFPSSNGFFTGHALARLYGALANQGILHLNIDTNGTHDTGVVPTRLVSALLLDAFAVRSSTRGSIGSCSSFTKTAGRDSHGFKLFNDC